jgi:single-strand DNA-binding protein
MSTINKVILIGRLGKDPDIRTTQAGKLTASFSLATSEKWKAKDGTPQEKTEWHNITVFQEGLAKVVEQYVKKGTTLYIEGSLETSKYTNKNGQEQYSTKVVLKGFNSVLQIISNFKDEQNRVLNLSENNKKNDEKTVYFDKFDDEIPF